MERTDKLVESRRLREKKALINTNVDINNPHHNYAVLLGLNAAT